MASSFIFADEAGCFSFKRRTEGRKDGPSDYFILTTVTAPEWTISDQLLAIRRELALLGEPDRDKLHATSDLQEVRNKVFAVLADADFRIDATILKKSKAQSKIRPTDERFYQYAWWYHFRHIGPKIANTCDKMLITAAALGTKKTRASFKAAVNDTVQQTLPRDRWEVAFHESCKDPLLWVADYCSWAIQKKWEHSDTRAFEVIADKIKTECDLFASGLEEFY
jgi:Protein of unknown function (DUF3800)